MLNSMNATETVNICRENGSSYYHHHHIIIAQQMCF